MTLGLPSCLFVFGFQQGSWPLLFFHLEVAGISSWKHKMEELLQPPSGLPAIEVLSSFSFLSFNFFDEKIVGYWPIENEFRKSAE
ncbi:MAG: hypothetical protein IPM82_03880 [Saprospiraceae bacterium]|nr:hypothetical protein [Saprospiraceae bacterium]